MPSPRLRAKPLRDGFPITVDEELADFRDKGIVREDLYRWRLSRYLLPRLPATATVARRQIQTARDHETRMWLLYPDGPKSLSARGANG